MFTVVLIFNLKSNENKTSNFRVNTLRVHPMLSLVEMLSPDCSMPKNWTCRCNAAHGILRSLVKNASHSHFAVVTSLTRIYARCYLW